MPRRKKYIVYIREEAQIEYEANSPKEALDQFEREINDHQEFLEEYGEFYITIERKNKTT